MGPELHPDSEIAFSTVYFIYIQVLVPISATRENSLSDISELLRLRCSSGSVVYRRA